MTRSNTAEITLTGRAEQHMGTVLSAEPLRVSTEVAEFEARVAASCLLAPEVGDAVLLSVPTRGPSYVLAVLERRSDAPARLVVEGGDVQIDAPDGRLSMSSPHGVDAVSGADLRFVSRELDVTAKDARLSFTSMVTDARSLLARIGVADTAFDTLETTATRLTQRLVRSYRFVEDQEVVRAGSLDTRARESLVLRAKDALLNARRLVRLDGEQIHLG
ncbi:MAG: DUF3540 domain-containing protein [Sandaracinaceae bacterium]